MRNKTGWAWTAATFFGIGLLKPGPGTWGSIAATAIWWGVARGSHLQPVGLGIVTAAGAAFALAVGIPAASIVERESQREDPGHVVLDEVAGQWIALIACPVSLRYALVALVLFRLFDIVKPPPARQLERLHGGAGIMLDDVAAGFYALLVFILIHHWW